LKIAVAGKGGVGKTTVAAYIARLLARDGKYVLAVDADPSPSLASALGVSAEERANVVPITKMSELIEERTGVAPASATPEGTDIAATSFGKFFTLNPKVDDIADRFAINCKDNVKLLVLGTIETAGSGCFCPENAILKSLLRHLILTKDDFVILDMEAGTEHLGRGTAKGLDLMLIVVEAGSRSIETAARIKKLASDLGIENIALVVNKVPSETEEKEIRENLSALNLPIFAVLPFKMQFIEADLKDESPLDYYNSEEIIGKMVDLKEEILKAGSG
jgi:CO dehydrogenase maturation factor